jgi:hypothetical protein
MKLKMPKMSKMPKLDKLLNNKNVLYAVFVIAILNLLGYLMMQNTEAVVFFLIVGFLTTYFSKNMTVVLIVAIVATSIFASTRITYIKEGMASKNKKSKKQSEGNSEKGEEEEHEKDGEDEDEELGSDDSHLYEKEENDDKMDNNMSEGMRTKNKVDYASTIEDAYAKLQNSVGKEGIQGLTKQTGDLLKQQKDLMDNIKGMEPFIHTAESFMKNLDMSSLDGITGMLEKMTGKK